MCFVLALLSKESAVAFVPLVLAGDYARAKLKPLHRYGWIVGVAVLYLAVLWRIQGGRFGEKGINFLDNPLAGLPASLRILNALRIAWKYVGLHVYPATLSCEYSYNAILLYSNWRRTAPAVIASALVLALWIWALQTKRREWFLAGAIYLGGFAATANLLVPTGTIMGERLAYLPSAGFCLLVALIWIRLERRERRLAWAMFGIIVAALATRTVIRNRDWRDNFTLFSADVRAVPGSAKMHANLGGVYLYRGQLDAARKEFQTALSIYSDFPAAMEYYGLVESRTGHDQEALRLLVGALSMTRKDDINYDFMAVNLASHFMKLGNKDDALKILDDDIAMSPGYARAWATRAALHYARGELTLARTDAQMALSLDPSNTQAQNLLNFTKAPASPAPVP
jgi:tetratricopeptide (TPR) repeat protein